MAKPELGTKRACTECGTKFYDLLKDPIMCPKCGATYEVAHALPKAERATAAALQPEAEEVETVLPEEGADLVSLEDAEAEQVSTGAKGKAVTDDALDIDEEVADDDAATDDDDTFLVEEEEDTDVADLIDGDIENEEEA